MTSFTWRDGERTIRFGRDALADAHDLLGDGYVLLTTPRARAAAPVVVDRAAHVIDVAPGLVDELAGDLLETLPDGELVALGGGRVIDTAKALGAAAGRGVGAIPTTLSAAEMTKVHRTARSAPAGTPTIRARIVINDPAVCASQPLEELAASAANALAHAVEGPTTILASPVPSLAAREAARLIAGAYERDGEPDREALALAALLSGYAIDGTWYGLSHVCSQTLVRIGGAAHGPANAAVLPHTAAALRERAPAVLADLDATVDGRVEDLASDLARRAGASRIRDLGVDESRLDDCADTAAQRPELQLTPPPATRDEIRAIYTAAW